MAKGIKKLRQEFVDDSGSEEIKSVLAQREQIVKYLDDATVSLNKALELCGNTVIASERGNPRSLFMSRRIGIKDDFKSILITLRVIRKLKLYTEMSNKLSEKNMSDVYTAFDNVLKSIEDYERVTSTLDVSEKPWKNFSNIIVGVKSNLLKQFSRSNKLKVSFTHDIRELLLASKSES
jgi:hypothetical protein